MVGRPPPLNPPKENVTEKRAAVEKMIPQVLGCSRSLGVASGPVPSIVGGLGPLLLVLLISSMAENSYVPEALRRLTKHVCTCFSCIFSSSSTNDLPDVAIKG